MGRGDSGCCKAGKSVASADHLHLGDVMDGRIILSDVPVLQRFLQSVGIGR
mgnify:FL=1